MLITVCYKMSLVLVFCFLIYAELGRLYDLYVNIVVLPVFACPCKLVIFIHNGSDSRHILAVFYVALVSSWVLVFFGTPVG